MNLLNVYQDFWELSPVSADDSAEESHGSALVVEQYRSTNEKKVHITFSASLTSDRISYAAIRTLHYSIETLIKLSPADFFSPLSSLVSQIILTISNSITVSKFFPCLVNDLMCVCL